jgi:hypothetical protein
MFSRIHSLALAGETFHPLLHVLTISTSEDPFPSIEAVKAFLIAFFAWRMEATVSTLCRVT